MKQLFLKNFFSGTCTLRGKNDVELIFDDSHKLTTSKIDKVF